MKTRVGKASSGDGADLNVCELLKALESVKPGLSSREIIEQSSCFVFKDRRVHTFNDDVGCSAPCEFAAGKECAVKALPLLDLLRIGGDEIDAIELGSPHDKDSRDDLVLTGPFGSAGVRMESRIQLPLDTVDPPTKWLPLPSGLDEALKRVIRCASTDHSEFVNTCVHFHPKWTEACDNFQLCRSKFTLGLEKPTLTRARYVKHLIGRALTEFSVAKKWLHFRDAAGAIISFRCWDDKYPSYTKFINQKGCHPLTLNSLVATAAKQAQIFSAENADEDQVMLTLAPGALQITGRGASGWRKMSHPVKYKGPKLAFNISPALLIEITKKSLVERAACEIGSGVAKLRGDGWIYLACLGPVRE